MLFCEFYLFLPCLSVIFGFAFCVLCLFVLVLLGYLVANGFCRRSVGAPVDEKEVSVSLVSLSFLPPPPLFWDRWRGVVGYALGWTKESTNEYRRPKKIALS